jgi:2-polyprenyl-3-methyl-5-hydroxy-6-metoxy-1,4-benzoquinol methylase
LPGTSRRAARAVLAYAFGRARSERPPPTASTGTGVLRAALFHYGRIVLNGNRTTHDIAAALAAGPGERVLDFGCGCGGLCVAVPGTYVGIDLDPNYIAFARWRWNSPRRRFLLTRLEDLGDDQRFDAAILASALHHLSDELADAIFDRLARMVTGRVVVLDHDPEAANRWQRFLIEIDRGEHVRAVADQRALLERHFVVKEQRRVVTTTGSAVHVVFVCTPR